MVFYTLIISWLYALLNEKFVACGLLVEVRIF